MLLVRGLVGGLLQLAFLAALLLIPAASWQWPRALQFLAVYGVIQVVGIVSLARVSPASLEARLSPPSAPTQPTADRIVTPLLFGALLAWFAFVPIDVFRLELLPPPPLAVSGIGAALALGGYGLIWVTLFQNAFAAPIVRDQTARGQVLIDTGPYARIRHPFYLGLLVFLLGLGLWLESTTSVLALLGPAALLVVRIRIEEQTLHETLPGYPDYVRRVRFRLLPGVW
ncbi:MAG: methyltransferase [Myxococcota bacterium]|nr:methyltransferase [Myxococcota bacterium]